MADVGDLGDVRLDGGGTLDVGPAGKTREALFAKQDGEGVDGDGEVESVEFLANVVNGEIAFAHGDGQIPHAVTSGSGLGTALRQTEERCAFMGIVSELVAEDAEGGRRIAKTACDVARRLILDEEGAESFVLTLQGELGGEKEFLIGGSDYVIHITGRHSSMML